MNAGFKEPNGNTITRGSRVHFSTPFVVFLDCSKAYFEMYTLASLIIIKYASGMLEKCLKSLGLAKLL